MFPLQQSEDLVFQILSNTDNISPTHQNKISQDLIFDTNFINNCSFAPLDFTTISHHRDDFPTTTTTVAAASGGGGGGGGGGSSRKRKRREGTKASSTDDITDDNHNKLKRIMHREIERQRRQEMATLYASLRSLLPLEYVKGKRSTSDHMHEALNYIKQMQKNVQELERRRDRLKIMSVTTTTTKNSISHNNNLEKTNTDQNKTVSSPNFVSVSRCRDGVEILINCVVGDGGERRRSCFPLSKVLRTLQKEGVVEVVTCDSTKADNRFLYRVQSEVCDEKHIDLEALQQKLNELINSF